MIKKLLKFLFKPEIKTQWSQEDMQTLRNSCERRRKNIDVLTEALHKSSVKLCIHCKWFYEVSGFGDDLCAHPDVLSPVNGSPVLTVKEARQGYSYCARIGARFEARSQSQNP